LKFNLAKIYTIGLTYIDDGQITSSCIEIRVSKMADGKRLQNKRVFTFSPDTKLFIVINAISTMKL
jgi:hypothetical protein